MSRVEVTSFSKHDDGSGKKIDVAFRNESDDLFYDFVNFYSGDENLDTELLDLAPGEEEKLSLDLDHVEKPLKIAQDNNSTVIYSEDSEQTAKEQKTGEKDEQPDQDEEKKSKEDGTEDQNDKPEGHQQTEQVSEEEKNRFDRVMEGEEEIDLPETEALADKVPDLSKTVKEMKEKTIEGLEKEKDKIPDRQTAQDKQKQESEEDKEEQEKASREKPSMLKSILHPFTRGKVDTEEPEEKDDGQPEEDAPERPEKASEDDQEEQQEDLSVTEKNDYSTERMTTGVINLDNKIEGGFVKGTMNLITGKTGTGKTAFCSNFIWEGAKKGEPGVYVTTEEREEDILEDINSMFGWDFDSLEEQDKVRVLSIKPVFPSQSMDNISRIVRSYISDLLDQVNEAIEEIGAERVVIDSVSLVQMFIQDEYMSRVALSSLMNNLREAGVTAVLVGSIPETSEGLSKQGIIEYLVDTVILLEFVPVAEDYNRTLKIRKMRRTDHDTDIFPFEVTADGLKVHEAYESI